MPTNDAKPLTGATAAWPVHFSQESVSVMSREPGELLRVVCWTWLRDGEETDGEVRATATLDDGTTVGGTLLGDVTVDDEDIPGARRRYVGLSFRIPFGAPGADVLVRIGGKTPREGVKTFSEEDLRGLEGVWGSHATPAELSDRYEEMFQFTKASAQDLAAQRASQDAFGLRPTFSIVVPLYHTPVDFFREMAESALRQSYGRLELVLVNSTPEDRELADEVWALANRDRRVRVVELERNYGITENTNYGIDAATGDFVCFFDHDDVLEPDLLYRYVEGINRYPQTDLLYCDEDKLEDGHYAFPFAKPDWSPVYLETNNYVCHMLTIRRSLLAELPRPTSEFDGAQDHRMTLLAGERARNVYHARRVLYHWRVNAGSTAGQALAKPEALDAGRRAIDEHYRRLGLPVRAHEVPGAPHYYEPLLDEGEHPSVSVVVWGAGAAGAAEGIRGLGGWDGLEVIAAEGGPAEANAAAERAAGEWLALVQSPCRVVEPDWARLMLSVLVLPGVGLAGARVNLPDGTKAGGALAFTNAAPLRLDLGLTSDNPQIRCYEAVPHEACGVTGTLLMLRRDLFLEVGGLDGELTDWRWGVALSCKVGERGLTTVEVPRVAVERPMTAAELGAPEAGADLRERMASTRLRGLWPQTNYAPSGLYSPLFSLDGYYDIKF